MRLGSRINGLGNSVKEFRLQYGSQYGSQTLGIGSGLDRQGIRLGSRVPGTYSVGLAFRIENSLTILTVKHASKFIVIFSS